MTKTSKTLLFFGNERLVSGLKSTDAPVLRALIANGYHIAAVISHHTDGQSRSNRPLEVAEIAKEHNIPVLLPNKPAEIIDTLASFNAEAAILVAYGRIIPQRIIDLFPKGIINIHPSLLPRYRGPTPIESAIANGDSEAGVSIMELTAGMDEGPVYAQSKIPLQGTETKFDLYESLSKQGTNLLIDSLPFILDGTLKPRAQDEAKATYCKLLTKSDSWLNPETQTAIEAERLVRAHLSFPKSKIKIANHDIIITKAHVGTNTTTSLDIPFKEGILSIDELIASSGRSMTADAFLRGYSL
ncbi:MAG TPA: methionyl-tRNA formyltransferase [Candidatus Saccharimonadales bacterium]|nr:methionyl-tRNA formyltransferase [Candidatus Saccharimonadales bacterium]